jgi:hypothetical protein
MPSGQSVLDQLGQAGLSHRRPASLESRHTLVIGI